MNKNIKLLITLAIVLLLLIIAVMMTLSDITIGKFSIEGVKKIKTQSMAVDSAIEQVKNLKGENFEKAREELETEASKLITAKKEYLDYINLSDDEQIIKASNNEKFTIEFLWTTLGNYATKHGVNVKFEILKSSTKDGYFNINFTVEGNYDKIIEYIYEIEEDSNLNFTIENFKLVKGEQNLIATFTINNISIDEKTMNISTSESSENLNNTNNENTTNTTNTESTANTENVTNTENSMENGNNS